MTQTTITDLVRSLNTTKTMVLPVDMVDPSTGTIETVKVDLEQILNLFSIIGNEPPTGVAHIWPTDNIPSGYLELNSQSFDPLTYPQLGLVWPSGILPDWRNRVPKATPEGASAGTTQEDALKSHSHSIVISNTDLGGKTTGTGGNHRHSISHSGESGSTGNNLAGAAYTARSTNSGYAGSHTHELDLGEHAHSATIGNTGGSENLVKSVFVRYIVRAR